MFEDRPWEEPGCFSSSVRDNRLRWPRPLHRQAAEVLITEEDCQCAQVVIF